MPTNLPVSALERSTLSVSAQFYDERGSAVIPDTLTYTLTDMYGNVVNNRITANLTPATAVVVGLTNNDLQISGYSGVTRQLLFEGTYTSVTLGANQSLRDWVNFGIINAVKVT